MFYNSEEKGIGTINKQSKCYGNWIIFKQDNTWLKTEEMWIWMIMIKVNYKWKDNKHVMVRQEIKQDKS